MKKIIIIFLILSLSLIPTCLNAVAITGVNYNGADEVEVGNEYRLHIEPGINGFMPGYNYTIGYIMVYIEVLYDEDVFLLENVNIPYFKVNFSEETKIEKNHRLIVAQLDDEDSPYLCGYDSLYCGKLNIDLNFFARNTDAKSSNIQIRNITLLYLDLDKTEEELNNMTEEEVTNYFLSNIKSSYKDVEVNKIVNIKNNNNTQIEEPSVTPSPNIPLLKPIIQVPKVETPTTPSTSNQTEKKSSNSYLRRLEVYNYKINFDKETKDYELLVSKEVNKLNIKAETDDPEAIYKIIGADDLKSNDYKVKIEVIAQDDSKSTYTINVKQKEETLNEEIPVESKEEKKVNVKLDKKIIKLLGGIGIGLLLIIIIIVINSIRKKKAINKMFNDL